MVYYQQGDVLIKQVQEIPEGLAEVERGERGHVLAEGEATGHAHLIADDVAVFGEGEQLFVRSDGAFTVTHEEHKPITVPAGRWRVDKVREWDHFEAEARVVRD